MKMNETGSLKVQSIKKVNPSVLQDGCDENSVFNQINTDFIFS